MPSLKWPKLALDVESTGLDLYHGARPYLVTIALPGGSNIWYEWPVNPINREVDADPEDLREIQEYVDRAEVIVGQNFRFDFGMLRETFADHGMEFRFDWKKLGDTLIAGHLLRSNHPHDLTSMALEYLSIDVSPYEDRMKEAVVEARKIVKQRYPLWRLAKAGLPEMPSARGGDTKSKSRGAEESGPWKYDSWLPRKLAEKEGLPSDHEWWTVTSDYANSDSATTLALWDKMVELIADLGLEKIYHESMKLPQIVASMERVGITLGLKRLKETEIKLSSEADECRKGCISLGGNELTKLPVNGTSNALRSVVFNRFGLQSPKVSGKTGQPSMDKGVLDHWIATLEPRSKPCVFVRNLREYRKRQTGLGYCKSYRKFMLPVEGDTYVIHSSLNATGTDTLRFSSSNPNQQQVSKQEESNARYAFGPGEGREWWSMDFENLELRIPAYEADEREMVELFERPDEPPYCGSYHLLVCDILHPKLFAECVRDGESFKTRYKNTWYQWVKGGNFSVQYGAIEKSGTADRAYHVVGAQRRIQNRFPKIRELNDRMIRLANEQGYVSTIPDRSVDPEKGYPLWCGRSRYGGVSPTVPLNYHVQSTAMWITRRAMVRCYEYLSGLVDGDYRMVMQVHDELVFDMPRGADNTEVVAELKRLMELGGKDVGVVTPVSVAYHPNNWAEEVSLD